MSEELFSAAGEFGERVRTFDWARTPLGPLASWPQRLVGYVSMILEMPTPAVIFWGPEQTQIYNEGYAEIMGPRHPTDFGAPFRACWPETHALIKSWMEQVLQRGAYIEGEDSLTTLARHGFEEEAYFTFTFSPLRDDDDAIAGILQPVIEVTDKRLDERRAEVLRALTPTTSSVDASVGDALEVFSSDPHDIPFAVVYLHDAVTGRLVRAGWSPNLDDCAATLGNIDAVADRAFDTHDPVLVEDAAALLGRLPAGPWPHCAAAAFAVPMRRSPGEAPRGVVVFGLSVRLPFDHGYRRFLELAAGQLASSLDRAVLVEHAELARRDAELRREHLASVVMQAPTPICVLRGPDYVIELANAPIARVWGRSADELLGRPLLDALPEMREQGFEGLLDGVFHRGEPYVGTEVLARFDRRGDGTLDDVYFNFVSAPLRGVGGDVEGIVTIALDVTEQVRARQEMSELRDAAEASNRAKDEFLAMLGHELRNPLSPLQTSLHLVRERLPASPVDRHLDIIERQANNLGRIVNDLLEASRVTQGRIELRTERVDLARAVAGALEATREYLDQRRHDVAVSMPMRPIHLIADPVRLDQILVNLLTNAAKYTETGGRIWVSGERVAELAEIRVRDNGVGITAELRPHLFELFQQGSRDIARAEGGLGIGLTIARRLIELHGGTIEVRSEGPGQGSEFIIRLPLAAEELAVTPTPDSRALATPPGHHRILVVDDNRDAAESLADLLDHLGHETRIAFDGPAALEVCEAWLPELVFLDIGLPGMDGYQVARELKRVHHDRPRLVALTGYGLESDRCKAREAGFDQHLVKPAQISTIQGILASLRAPS